MTTPEGLNTKALKRFCSELGIAAFKMSFEGTVGAPDWLLMRRGKHILVELKARKNGKLSRPQERMIDRLIDDGGFEVFVCDSPESIKLAINRGLFGCVNVTEDL